MEIIKSEKYYEYVYKKAISDKIILSFFPEDIPKNIVYKIITEYQKGRRSEDISKEFWGMFFDISKKNLVLITQTICSIASSAETKFKSQSLGLNWYVWRTCEDQRVRKSHKMMEGVLINFDNPPSPESLVKEESIGTYNAGECFICRCYPSPIVKLDFIKFPCKVYYNGKIQTMTKKQFEVIM